MVNIPPIVERRQRSWDLNFEAKRLRDEGLTLREIGKRIGGVSQERARQRANKADRDIKYGRLPPIEHFEKYGEEINLHVRRDER